MSKILIHSDKLIIVLFSPLSQMDKTFFSMFLNQIQWHLENYPSKIVYKVIYIHSDKNNLIQSVSHKRSCLFVFWEKCAVYYAYAFKKCLKTHFFREHLTKSCWCTNPSLRSYFLLSSLYSSLISYKLCIAAPLMFLPS